LSVKRSNFFQNCSGILDLNDINHLEWFFTRHSSLLVISVCVQRGGWIWRGQWWCGGWLGGGLLPFQPTTGLGERRKLPTGVGGWVSTANNFSVIVLALERFSCRYQEAAVRISSHHYCTLWDEVVRSRWRFPLKTFGWAFPLSSDRPCSYCSIVVENWEVQGLASIICNW